LSGEQFRSKKDGSLEKAQRNQHGPVAQPDRAAVS
jgi:hypothetical protein